MNLGMGNLNELFLNWGRPCEAALHVFLKSGLSMCGSPVCEQNRIEQNRTEQNGSPNSRRFAGWVPEMAHLECDIRVVLAWRFAGFSCTGMDSQSVEFQNLLK